MSRFTKATKKRAKARIAICGPSGSGKTFTALTIARGLGERIAVIDTERGSASKYAGTVANFDALDLDVHDPREYVRAIADAASEGFDVLVIDSLSHAWSGKEGALEQVDKAAARSRSGNSFAAWREVTPLHNQLVDAILRFPGHVIATMRSKMAYEIQEHNGRKTPVKIGLAPIQRDGIEYEFDLVADMDHENTLVVTKSRCSALARAVVREPGDNIANALRSWLDDGDEPTLMKPIETHDPTPLSAPLALHTYSPEEQARADAQAVTAKVLGDGLIDDFKALTTADDALHWIASNVGVVDALGRIEHKRIGDALIAWCETGIVEGMNGDGFRAEWQMAVKASRQARKAAAA